MNIIGGAAHLAGRGVRDAARFAELEARGRARAQQRLAQAQQGAGAARAGTLAVPMGTVAARPAGVVARREQQPIPGPQLFRYIRSYLAHFAYWPSEATLTAVTLWVLQAAARAPGERGMPGRPLLSASPRLMLTSSQNGSGKSTGLDLFAALLLSQEGRICHFSGPGITKLMAENKPALLDEVQLLLGADRKSRDCQAVLSAGYTPRASAVVQQGNKSSCGTAFGVAAFAGRDDLIKVSAATGQGRDLLARCIILTMTRPPRRMPELDDDAYDAGTKLGTVLAAWSAQERDAIRAAAKHLAQAYVDYTDDMPDVGDGGRAAQLWRPLIAQADVLGQSAGGEDIPGLAREAFLEVAATTGGATVCAGMDGEDGPPDIMGSLHATMAGLGVFGAYADEDEEPAETEGDDLFTGIGDDEEDQWPG